MRSDDAEIRTPIERWAMAVHSGDIDRVLANHADDIVMFDVPPDHRAAQRERPLGRRPRASLISHKGLRGRIRDMQKFFVLIALATGSIAAAVAALDSATPVSDAVRSAADRAANNFIAAAEEMPADKYGFKPTPAQMSFGDVVGHMSAGNDALCSSIGGVAAPKRSAVARAQKEKLVDRLRETFQFCKSALAKVDDSRLGEKISYFGADASRAQVMVAAAEEWAGHYSQIAVYLRLNGLVPPTAKR